MNSRVILSIGLIVLLAGCSGLPRVGNPEGSPENPDDTGNINELKVKYLGAYSESSFEYISKPTIKDKIIIGDEGGAQDLGASQSYSVVNAGSSEYRVELKITHGKAILRQKSYTLAFKEGVNVKVYPPNGKFDEDMSYRMKITVYKGDSVVSEIAVIAPEESFWCNSKSITISISKGGSVGHRQYQTMMACTGHPVTK